MMKGIALLSLFGAALAHPAGLVSSFHFYNLGHRSDLEDILVVGYGCLLHQSRQYRQSVLGGSAERL